MITHITGDLLKSGEMHIAHGCNTEGKMGAGVALAIATRYPRVRRLYQAEVVQRKFIIGSAFPVQELEDPWPTIWNLGTQKAPGPNASLWAVLLSFGNMFERMVEWDVGRVAIPRIGAGIGGLRWTDVEDRILYAQSKVPNAPEVVVYTLESEVERPW